MAASISRRNQIVDRGIYFRLKNYGYKILSLLLDQRNRQQYCGLAPRFSGHTIFAHECVLGVWSELIAEKFLQLQSNGADDERKTRIVEELTRRISFEVFITIVNFMYTGRLNATQQNQEELKKGIKLLKISELENFQSFICTTSTSSSSSSASLKDFGNRFLSKLREFRKRGQLCDVTLCVAGKKFHAHKSVLAVCSPYFEAMFTNDMSERHQRRINLPSLTEEQGRLLMTFMYNGALTLNADNIDDSVVVADYFRVQKLKEFCSKFLTQTLCSSNCMGYMYLAEHFNFQKVHKTSKIFLQCHFTDVLKEDEVLSLSSDQLIEVITDEDNVVEVVQQGKIVTNEICIFEMIVQWIRHDLDIRKEVFPKLFTHINLQSMSAEMIKDNILNHDLVQEFPNCKNLADETLQNLSLHSHKSVAKESMMRRGKLLNVLVMVEATSIFKRNSQNSGLIGYMVEEMRPVHLPSMPVDLTEASAVVYGNILYVAGGMEMANSIQTPTKYFFCYDPFLNIWRTLPNLLEAVIRGRLVGSNRCIFLIGRKDSNSMIVQKYNITAAEWTFGCQMNDPIYGRFSCVDVSDEKFYTVSLPKCLSWNILYRYSIADDNWQEVTCPEMPIKSSLPYYILPATCTTSGKFYVTDFHELHCVFDIEEEKWEIQTEHCIRLPYREESSAHEMYEVCMMEDKLYLFGKQVHSYNINSHQWQSLESFSTVSTGRDLCWLQIPSQFL